MPKNSKDEPDYTIEWLINEFHDHCHGAATYDFCLPLALKTICQEIANIKEVLNEKSHQTQS